MLVDILSRLVDSVGDPSPDVQVVDLSDIPSCHQNFLYLLDCVFVLPTVCVVGSRAL